MRRKLILVAGSLSLVAIAITSCIPPTPTSVATVSLTGEAGAPAVNGSTVNYAAPSDSVIAGERTYTAPAEFPQESSATLYVLVNEPTRASLAWSDFRPTSSTPLAIELRQDGSSAPITGGTTYQIVRGNVSGPYEFVIYTYGPEISLKRNCYANGTVRIDEISANLASTSTYVTAGSVSTLKMSFDLQCNVGYDPVTDTILTKRLTGSVNIHP